LKRKQIKMKEKILFFIESNQHLMTSKNKFYQTIMLIGIFVKWLRKCRKSGLHPSISFFQLELDDSFVQPNVQDEQDP
jgi:hypothetical protein